MDYVLFGMGYGATLMLLGWALRTFGPERKYKDVDPEDIDRTVMKSHWIRFIQGLGGVISIAGTAMVLFTFVIMLVNPDDGTGEVAVMTVWGFLAVAILIWCWFYISNFGASGIWSREYGYGSTPKSTSRLRRSSVEGVSTSRVVPRPRVTNRSAPGVPVSQANDVDPSPGQSTPDEPGVVVGPMAPENSRPEAGDEIVGPPQVQADADVEAGTDPEYDFGDSSDTTVPAEVGGRAEAIRRMRERQSRLRKTSNSG